MSHNCLSAGMAILEAGGICLEPSMHLNPSDVHKEVTLAIQPDVQEKRKMLKEQEKHCDQAIALNYY